MASERTPALRQLRPGKPAAYQFFGLFLPSVEWEMQTEGIPWHELENLPKAMGTLFRNMRRRDVDPTAALLEILPELRQRMPPSTATLFDAAATAIKEGRFTDDLLTQMPGHWACFRMGAPNWRTPYFEEYERIEVHSEAADAALHEGNYRHAAELVQSNPDLRAYWCDAALQGLASATTPDETLRPRLQAWLQLQVDVLAKWSVSDPKALQAQHDCGLLVNLLAGLRDQGTAAPGAQWLRAMLTLTAAPSLAKLIQQVSFAIPPPDLPSEATIKRWHRGSQFPMPTNKLENFIERVSRRAALANPNLNRERILESANWYYWAARRFESVLWFATLLHSGESSSASIGEKDTHAPSQWLRTEFKRMQTSHVRQSGSPMGEVMSRAG